MGAAALRRGNHLPTGQPHNNHDSVAWSVASIGRGKRPVIMLGLGSCRYFYIVHDATRIGNSEAIFPHARDVNLDGCTQSTFCFFHRSSRGDAPRQIGDVRRVVGFPLLNDNRVTFHFNLAHLHSGQDSKPWIEHQPRNGLLHPAIGNPHKSHDNVA